MLWTSYWAHCLYLLYPTCGQINMCLLSLSPSCVPLFATPWTVAHQIPLFMEFSRQEYWSGLPFPTPGDLPNPGIKTASPALRGRFFTTVSPGKHEIDSSSQINWSEEVSSLAFWCFPFACQAILSPTFTIN